MPFLGGLFSRKSKSSPRSKRDDHAASSMYTSELDSAISSPTTSYVTPDNSIPSNPNARNLLHPDSAHELPSSNVYPSLASTGATSTGKKLRLPFTRKKVILPRSDLSIGSSPSVNSPNFNSSPQSANNSRQSTSALVSKTDPEGLRRLRPPPSRSAIFAAYGDPTNNPSIHSLSDEVPVLSKLSFPSSPLPQASKKTSLFSWSKGSSKSSPRSPLSDSTKSALDHVLPTGPDPGSSFNLKSFRHIREPSSTHSNASNVSLALPVPRPRLRGESINSDSSQRISVAAFREVQARRSLAGSPSPSFRAPSPVPPFLPPSTSSSSPQNGFQPRGQSMLLYTSDSDSSTSSDDGTEDETIKRRPGLSHSGHNNYERKDKGKAKSDMGHKNGNCDSAASQRAPQSHSGHSRQPSGESKPGITGYGLDFPRSQSNLGHNSPAPKLRASVSTTASSSFATVKLAGTQVTLTPTLDIAGEMPSRETPLSTHSNSRNLTQRLNNLPQKYKPASDSEDDSEDDAPLAALLGPRRPGSAMSSYSSAHARSTGNVTTRSTRSGTLGLAKPLIDINELTGSKPSFTAAEKSTAGFTQGATLLSGTRLSTSPSSLSTENPSDLNLPLTRKVPPMKFVSPPSSPPKEAMRLTPRAVDGGNTARSDPISLPSEKSASLEQHRDALTERLSRAVNIKVVPSSSKPSVSMSKNPVPAQTKSLNICVGDTSEGSCQLRSEMINFPSTKDVQPQLSVQRPSPAPASEGNRSPPDEGLAELLGTAGINFMFHNDEVLDQSSESESEEDEDPVESVKSKEVVQEEGSESEDEKGVKREEIVKEEATSGNRIAPIPIKERPPTSSFSVTSRPPFPGRDSVAAAETDASILSTASNVVAPRSRSITLTPSSNPINKVTVNNDIRPVPSNVPSKSTSNNPSPKVRNDALKVPNARQRSSTMVTGVPLNVPTAKAFHVPERPFAIRRNSPASSTEDSSSGRAPLTPRDGSEIDVQDRKRHEWSGGAGGLGVKKHFKHRSVSFEEDHNDSKSRGIPHSKGKQHTNSNAVINDEDREARRKERRRGEAKAAIELGNVVNGPAPILDDEDEMINHNISPRMSTLNPMMGIGLQMPMQIGFGSPNSVPSSLYSMPPPADPNFLAAHQHAMLYAKQAYQMAVAQQAMAAAGDEWERSSSIGGYGGSSSMMSSQFGMMPMGQGYGWSGPSSIYLPSSSQSAYGGLVNSGGAISNSRSEHGGISGPKNWPSSRSSYGASFGPSLDQLGRKKGQGSSGHAKRDSVSTLRAPVMPAAQPQNGRGSPVLRSGNGQRESTYLPPVSSMPASQFQNGRGSPDGTPRPRTGNQPASPSRSTFVRKAPPPSSWKSGN